MKKSYMAEQQNCFNFTEKHEINTLNFITYFVNFSLGKLPLFLGKFRHIFNWDWARTSALKITE